MELTAEQVAALQTELEKLRTVNVELVAKHTRDKSKITELQSSFGDLQEQLAASQKALNAAVVDVPLRNMAEKLSNAPELFLEQFAKSYRVEMQDGKLTVMSIADNKPVDLPFERDAIAKHLTDEQHPQATTFRAIVVTSRASGAAGSTQSLRQDATGKPQKLQFGFR
jgi:hypothetical protein